MLDLHDGDFIKAVEITESNIMNTAISAHLALRDGRPDEANRLFAEVAGFMEGAHAVLLSAVLEGIADAAAGMYLRVAELEGEDAPDSNAQQARPDMSDPGIKEEE